MAGKQEHKPGVVINYKNKLDDRFVDLATQKTTSEANEYLTQFNTEKTRTLGSVSPYFYHSNVRPGAKAPLSVEMAQHIFNITLDALRAEIARAYSSEKYLSDFMKENMVTKSEDQTISGFKKFDSVQVDHADIDTELVDDSTTRHIEVTEKADISEEAVGLSNINVLNVSQRMNLPTKIPSNPRLGDIWVSQGTTDSGGSGEAAEFHQEFVKFVDTETGVSTYDGSVFVGEFKTDSDKYKVRFEDNNVIIPLKTKLNDFITPENSGIILTKNDDNETLEMKIDLNWLNGFIDDYVDVVSKNSNLTATKTAARKYELDLQTLQFGEWPDRE